MRVLYDFVNWANSNVTNANIFNDLTSASSGGPVLRWNSSGNLEPIPHNLVDYSADLSQWTATNVSAAGGATPPNGVGDAYTLTLSGGSVQHFVSRNQTVTVGRSATYSIYAKEGTLKRLVIWSGDNGQEAAFDLNTVSVVGSSGMTGAITSVGDGWYRVSGKITSLANGGSRAFRVYALPDTGTGTGDATFSDDGATLLLAGAQVEEHTALRVYQETTGSAFYGPIIQHDPDGTNRRLANVPSFTNLSLRSEDFSNWTDQNTTVTANSTAAPDGETTADTIADNSAAAAGRRYRDLTVADDSNDHVVSVFIKKDSNTDRFPLISANYFGGTATTGSVSLNTSTGASADGSPGGPSGSTDVIDSGDYWEVRFVHANNGAGNTTLRVSVYPSWSTTLGGAGDNSLQDSVIAWGVMVAKQSYHPGVYLPTTTAARTYNGSRNSIANLNLTGDYTIYVEYSPLYTPGASDFLQPLNVFIDSNNRVTFYLNNGNLNVDIRESGTTTATLTSSSSATAGTTYKAIVRVKTNDAALYVDGASKATDTSVTPPTGTFTAYTYNVSTPTEQAQDNFKFQIWNRALSNAELAAETS